MTKLTILNDKLYTNLSLITYQMKINLFFLQNNLWLVITYCIQKPLITFRIRIKSKLLTEYKWQTYKQVPYHNRRCQNDKLDYFEWQTAYKYIFINIKNKIIDICIYIPNNLLSYHWQRCQNDKLDYFEW